MSQTTTRTIAVYRESPLWAGYTRWFNMPINDLNTLFVARYTIDGEWISEADVERHATELRQIHHDCVLVY